MLYTTLITSYILKVALVVFKQRHCHVQDPQLPSIKKKYSWLTHCQSWLYTWPRAPSAPAGHDSASGRNSNFSRYSPHPWGYYPAPSADPSPISPRVSQEKHCSRSLTWEGDPELVPSGITTASPIGPSPHPSGCRASARPVIFDSASPPGSPRTGDPSHIRQDVFREVAREAVPGHVRSSSPT
jgi:hypothetical protein